MPGLGWLDTQQTVGYTCCWQLPEAAGLAWLCHAGPGLAALPTPAAALAAGDSLLTTWGTSAPCRYLRVQIPQEAGQLMYIKPAGSGHGCQAYRMSDRRGRGSPGERRRQPWAGTHRRAAAAPGTGRPAGAQPPRGRTRVAFAAVIGAPLLALRRRLPVGAVGAGHQRALALGEQVGPVAVERLRKHSVLRRHARPLLRLLPRLLLPRRLLRPSLLLPRRLLARLRLPRLLLLAGVCLPCLLLASLCLPCLLLPGLAQALLSSLLLLRCLLARAQLHLPLLQLFIPLLLCPQLLLLVEMVLLSLLLLLLPILLLVARPFLTPCSMADAGAGWGVVGDAASASAAGTAASAGAKGFAVSGGGALAAAAALVVAADDCALQLRSLLVVRQRRRLCREAAGTA